MAYDKLFEPIKIGSTELKNRYVMAPCNFLFPDWTGMITETDIAYYVARAKGGAGLCIVGAILCTDIGKPVANIPWPYLTSIEHIPGMSMLAESIRVAGSKAIAQILPASGSRGNPMRDDVQPFAPSEGIDYKFGTDQSHGQAETIITKRMKGKWLKEKYMRHPKPRAITVAEMEQLIEESARNAKLAVLAGFDGVELHLCHHYILDQFRDPRFNLRTDKYGGSRENRNRFILEYAEAVIKSLREEREDFTIGVRVGSECGGEGGYTLDDTKWLAVKLQELGIDYWSTTIGFPPIPEAKMDSKVDGGYLNWSRQLRDVVKVPILTPSVHSPDLAEEAVTKGWTDMVGLGRPLVADPDLVNKVRENRVADINRCKKDNLCWVGFDLCLPGRCSANPGLGREKYNPRYMLTEGFKGAKMLPHVLRK
ncbi:NADH:flavin oxidoreductase [Desulfotignum balticum]|uniref:Putative 2-enoate reductase n=1 Tax=Desulfotignum balticum TaxID=115781 RepID=C4B7T5_9BACT|nr:NADH:flavin oxidoreductase [Desulfotignum balticum]BAH60917.1 putative 2-enoate reductase [Desulfotignum balticum]